MINMNNIKKRAIFFLILFLLFGLAEKSLAEQKVEVLFFFSQTCSHCAKENAFLETLEKKYSEIEVKRKEVGQKENIELLKQYYQQYRVEKSKQGQVPITFIKDRYFLGYTGDLSSGQEIENYIQGLIGTDVGYLQPELKKEFNFPLIGRIDLSNLSPLFLAIFLGLLDGFNACAMVALGFLLAVLIGTGIRKRLVLIGGTFIVVSGLVYFVFISAWLNLFFVLGQIKIIGLVVGLVIVLLSLFLLKEYFHGVFCRLCDLGLEGNSYVVRLEKKLFKKMRRFAEEESSLLTMLVGVAIVAAGINLIELVCSFGFPLAFTKILADLELPTFVYYLYILIYIIFYMLDDFLVFLIAVWTLKTSRISQKYMEVIKLISGLALLVLGLLMIFAPGFLAWH